MKRLCCYVILSLVCQGLSAATYYVSTTGSDSNPGTEAQPYLTFAKLDNVMASGDTCIVRGGLYEHPQAAIGWSLWPGKGTGISNIVIQAYPGEVPVIHHATNNSPAIYLQNVKNCVIDGLVCSNNLYSFTLLTCSNISIVNCGIGWKTDGLGIAPQLAMRHSIDVTVSNCVIRDCGYVGWDGEDYWADAGDSIIVGWNDTDTGVHDTANVRFLNNTVIHAGHVLLHLASRSMIVRSNVFYNDNWMLATNGQYYGNRLLSFLGAASTNALVEWNRFGYNGIPPDSQQNFPCVEVSGSTNIIRFNSFYRLRGSAVNFYQKGYGQTPAGNRVYHNSILNPGWDTTGNAVYDAQWRPTFSFMHATCTNNYVLNNLISLNGYTNVYHFAIGGLSNSQARLEVNFETDSPGFLNTNMPGESSLTLPDLRTTSGGAGIDQAGWLTTVTGGSSTSLEVADAGYFYDGFGIPGEVGDTIQLQGQTTTATITAISGNTLTLSTTLTWTNGQGVALAYSGTAPDIGAFEYRDPQVTNRHIRATTLRVGTIR